MKVVALVPVKLHSQRVPGKNAKELGGHPLCWHVCNTLLNVSDIDEVCVYCSSEDVVPLLPERARWVQRPEYLDHDEVKGAQIYRSFLDKVDADVYVLAHTTSPFLREESVREGLRAILDQGCDSAFTARRFQTFAWYDGKPLNYELEDVPRTQDMKPVWVETSGFYMFRREVFAEHGRRIGMKPHVVEVGDIEAIDIDEPEDFEFASLVASCLGLGQEKD
jgi:CMP-N-acetylneuraminic acid synthetase